MSGEGALTAWWALSALMVVVGLAGTVLPALPGTVLILGGVLLGAWIDDFQRIGPWIIGVQVLLTVLSFALEYAAGLMGAKRVGASRQALIGAMIGTVAGILMGIVGVLFMPLVGAAIGEYLARRDHRHSVRVGVATWVGLMLGMIAKVVIAFVMTGLYVAALLVNR